MFEWSLNGPIHKGRSWMIVSNFVQADVDLSRQVENFWKLDICPDVIKENEHMSKNDLKVLQLWETTTTLEDGHYQMRIPFRSEVLRLPNNYCIAETRLQGLGRKLSRDVDVLQKYRQEIDNLVTNGYAEKVIDSDRDKNPDNGKIWYIPHHGVTNINKPGKLRIVFDCAATFCGMSLNSEVLQGPDLSNRLFDVLLRFREHGVAVMGDIEAMFHQVKVHPDDRDVLRFLW